MRLGHARGRRISNRRGCNNLSGNSHLTGKTRSRAIEEDFCPILQKKLGAEMDKRRSVLQFSPGKQDKQRELSVLAWIVFNR